MRRWAAAVVCALSLTAQAQVALSPTMLIPNPLGVVIMIGKWIWDNQTQQEVYYIQVIGQGADLEQARNNGFRLAVEQAVGTLILSETVTSNQRIVRNDIVTYAAGFVNRFTILNQTADAGQMRVTMDVWVGKSGIAQRLMNESVAGRSIDGTRLDMQMQTLATESSNKVRAVQTILADFPQRAFDIDTGNIELAVVDRRSARFETPVTIRWNRAYLDSLIAVLAPGAVVQCGWPQARFCARGHARYTFSTRTGFTGTDIGLDDPEPIRTIVTQMMSRKPALRLSVLDAQGREMSAVCRRFIFSSAEQQNAALPRYLFNESNLNIVIDPGYSLSGHILITANTVENAARIEVRAVPESQCQR